MRENNHRPPYLELCLCHRCASIYFNDPAYWIEKAEPYQDVTEPCDLCKRNHGIDYNIWKSSTVRTLKSHHCGGDRK